MAKRARAQGHLPRIEDGRLWCDRCGKRSKLPKGEGLVGHRCKAAAAAEAAKLPGTHASHRVAVYRGVNYCKMCGAWGVHKIMRLQEPCKGQPKQNSAGAKTLRLMAKGRPPIGLAQWPDGR